MTQEEKKKYVLTSLDYIEEHVKTNENNVKAIYELSKFPYSSGIQHAKQVIYEAVLRTSDEIKRQLEKTKAIANEIQEIHSDTKLP